jgi:putative ABC transport system permease protein
MQDIKLAFTYLRTRSLVSALTILSVALGLGLAIMVLVLLRQTTDTLQNESGNWDLVVGAKGSPLQVVLNGLYYLDAPTGNIDVAIWHKLQQDPAVEEVVPLTMGDNYLGWPIIGTEQAFFSGRSAAGGGPLLASGRQFAKPFEIVAGAEVARRQQLHLGQELVGAHGWTKSDDLHPQFPYTLVGILAPTGASLDRALYTDYHSTWIVHSHPDEDEKPAPGHDPTKEVTSLLLKLHQPGYRFQLQQEINTHEIALAASPAEEINKLSATLLAPLQGVLLLVAYLVIIVSALSILISLYLTIFQRRRDLAIFRSLGATRADVFRLITLEAALLSGLGVVAGWLLGHGALAALYPVIITRFGLSISPWQVLPVELAIGVSVWLLGVLAGLLPAVVAYRLPVAETLIRDV